MTIGCRNYLKGRDGDRTNAVHAATGYNIEQEIAAICSTQSGSHRYCGPAAVARCWRPEFPIVFAILTSPVGEGFVKLSAVGRQCHRIVDGGSRFRKASASTS